VYGNIKTLEASIEGGEVEIKSDETMSRLEADVEELKDEVKTFNIHHLMVGEFGVYTIFTELRSELCYSALLQSSKEDDDHADGRDGQEGRVGERIIDQVVVQDETTGVDG